MPSPSDPHDTRSESYADRLSTLSTAWWKRLLPVQAPYRWNLRRQRLGRTLDVGCGIGRNLAHLDPGSVGVDHNETAIARARAVGLDALTVEEWGADPRRGAGGFDAMLLAHVVEHMDEPSAVSLLEDYLPSLRPGGRVLMICPQERGYATDETHVRFTDDRALESLAQRVGLVPERSWSFPLPRSAGKAFAYNEFCVVARKP